MAWIKLPYREHLHIPTCEAFRFPLELIPGNVSAYWQWSVMYRLWFINRNSISTDDNHDDEFHDYHDSFPTLSITTVSLFFRRVDCSLSYKWNFAPRTIVIIREKCSNFRVCKDYSQNSEYLLNRLRNRPKFFFYTVYDAQQTSEALKMVVPNALFPRK